MSETVPVVLIISYGRTKPIEIVDSIININNEEKSAGGVILVDGQEFPTYECPIITKYYKTTIELLPFEDDIALVPPTLWKRIEAVIIYFDAHKRLSLNKLPDICDTIQKHNIELGLLLTNKLFDSELNGLTYGEVKDATRIVQFDLIELFDDTDNDDESVAKVQPDYKEVIEALQNNIWSTVNTTRRCPSDSQNPDCDQSENYGSFEQRLEEFEALFASIQDFKMKSANMERDEVLDQAEKLADLFTELLNEK